MHHQTTSLRVALWLMMVVVVVSSLTGVCLSSADTNSTDVIRMRFIVTVNTTWSPQNSSRPYCLATDSTPFLDSDRSYNETRPISVGICDNGPLVFSVLNASRDSYSKLEIDLTFFSSVYGSSYTPTCRIPWNGTYLNPTTAKMERSPLPSCFVKATALDKGNRTADYWFHVMEWEM